MINDSEDNRFFSWPSTQGKIANSPMHACPRRVTAHKTPFMFDKTRIQRLLSIAKRLPDNPLTVQGGESYSMVFALFHVRGLRTGEVARLCLQDVGLDQRLFVIRKTKFPKSCLVQVGPRLAQRLKEYLQRCKQYRGTLRRESPVFSLRNGRPISPETISIMLHSLPLQLDLRFPPGVASSRTHSLRHRFAVGTLLHWYRTDVDANQRLIHSSTFLGHIDPGFTSVYLTISLDLLREAGNRFARFATPAPEILP